MALKRAKRALEAALRAHAACVRVVHLCGQRGFCVCEHLRVAFDTVGRHNHCNQRLNFECVSVPAAALPVINIIVVMVALFFVGVKSLKEHSDYKFNQIKKTR